MLIPYVRKIHNINSSKVIGFSYSFKMKGQIPWESTLERDWLLHLEANLDLREIYGQPNTFDYCFEGKWHRYTPDFEARWHDPNRLPTLYEVKPDDVANTELFRQESDCRRQALAMYGYEYVVKGEHEIRRQPILNNLNLLKLYADVFVTCRDRDRITYLLADDKEYSLQWLSSQLGARQPGLAGLYHLLWEGWLDHAENHMVTPLLQVRQHEGAW